MDQLRILITGAGKGIGRSVAMELSRQLGVHTHLLLQSRTKSDLESLRDTCRAIGTTSDLLAGDLTDATHRSNLVAFIEKEWLGQIDVFVHCAGVGRFGDLSELTEGDVDFVINTNVKATFLLTQSLFALMKRHQKGHVILVTSTAAEKPYDQSALYCMSKFAQKGLVEVLRNYGYRNRIRVTNVMPGPVHTPMWGHLTAEQIEKMARPEDIARMIVEAIRLPERATVEELVIRPITGDFPNHPTA